LLDQEVRARPSTFAGAGRAADEHRDVGGEAAVAQRLHLGDRAADRGDERLAVELRFGLGDGDAHAFTYTRTAPFATARWRNTLAVSSPSMIATGGTRPNMKIMRSRSAGLRRCAPRRRVASIIASRELASSLPFMRVSSVARPGL